MTKMEKTEMTHEIFEKAWYASKKFIAFALVEVLMAVMAIVAVKHQANLGWPLSAFMTGIVFVMGFVAVVFLGKQADLDKFVRMAAIQTGQGAPNAEERKVPTPEPDGTGK
jgi:formate/nitrite transporter FocA (FNT family)